ncbi:uncharacterized protein CYBJADRAFT_12802 [Cyberlindnera jadinii NRRL Y-1542]|uniref:Zn(2)-C6 fungal-type domain-containing protein n=1 Tax=Cyberlindnera jadinii (strain ATCC 18201 / CBS 1600 / BCRC 20928 / JCM 3617 / NBRC 0987 / NRRL Y-1542) TaxID=983966 RepID=A0A1E4SAA4_CYBJN|nr:hypothetical protein CYBJADRAFT_12802 [Cyberlindnera jadinii NRRL Y-1542]ODV76450.1 hypothetical protein CYBJADRAFT_12802 [Cyberlindnera jadinii NRRL Y-1542]
MLRTSNVNSLPTITFPMECRFFCALPPNRQIQVGIIVVWLDFIACIKSRIIPPDKRKKVAQACDKCKRRKQKCNGLQPCNVCHAKGFTCEYTAIDKRILKSSKKNSLGPESFTESSGGTPIDNSSVLSETPGTVSEDRQEPGQQQQRDHLSTIDSNPFINTKDAARIPSSLQPLLSFPLNITEGHDDAIVSLGSDQNWRLLFDDGGNLRFLGESCGISYLLQCRKLFSKVLGHQSFSDDPERLRYNDRTAIVLNGTKVPLPSREYTDYLVRTFMNNLNNVLYIVDYSAIPKFVDDIYRSRNKEHDKCILMLILAIGSIFAKAELLTNVFPFPKSQYIEHVEFFQSANTILNSVLEDGDLWLVETHLLIFFYYHFAGFKHLAWVKLGNAIRHAQGLGLQRKYVNESFKSSAVVLHRRRLFISLFIMDTLSAVHLGRSMTLRENEWDDMQSLQSIDDFSQKLLQVCLLNSEVLRNIYFNPSVTIKSALKLAVQLKLYALRNPVKPMSLEVSSAPVDHKFLLPYVIYLHSIVLLSRPFFHFVILNKLGLVNYTPDPTRISHLKSFYQSCIKASLLVIKTVEYCYYQNIHPFKPMSLVSCTFHAGLVLGLLLLLKLRGIDDEMFADDPSIVVDKDAMILNAMSSIIKVLDHCGKLDPQSKRYSVILQSMLNATEVKKPDIAGMTNSNSNGQFLDDLLYNVLDNGNTDRQQSSNH